MDLNKLRVAAITGTPVSSLPQLIKLGTRVVDSTEKLLSLSPEAIADGASQEKADFLKKLRTISVNGEGIPVGQSE